MCICWIGGSCNGAMSLNSRLFVEFHLLHASITGLQPAGTVCTFSVGVTRKVLLLFMSFATPAVTACSTISSQSQYRVLSGQYLNDLTVFDPVQSLWTTLGTSKVRGYPPSPRKVYYIACSQASIYIYGGYNGEEAVYSNCSMWPRRRQVSKVV